MCAVPAVVVLHVFITYSPETALLKAVIIAFCLLRTVY
jgi:hypothetical protein